MISSVDGYASVLMEWALDKYQVIFYNNLMKFVSTVKDFYSSENNDFARITLRFLTLAIPQKDYIDSIYPQKFIESFKYDHQFSKESFQKTLNRFYIHAKEHWLVNQQSKPLDIVRNSLYIVASTMEDILFPHDSKIPGFAQKMADYFCNDNPNRTLFSRKHFREFFKTLVRVPELDEVQKKITDQYVQTASILFDLTSMSNKDLIDWTVNSFKMVKNQVNDIVTGCN